MLVYLGISVSEISKTVTYEIWYDFIKPKYLQNVKLCYMEIDGIPEKWELGLRTRDLNVEPGAQDSVIKKPVCWFARTGSFCDGELRHERVN